MAGAGGTAQVQEGLRRLRAAQGEFRFRMWNIQKLYRRAETTRQVSKAFVDALMAKLLRDVEVFFVPAAEQYMKSVEGLPSGSLRGDAGKAILEDYFGAMQDLQRLGLDTIDPRRLAAQAEGSCRDAMAEWRSRYNSPPAFSNLLAAVHLALVTGNDSGPEYLKAQMEVDRTLALRPSWLRRPGG